MTMPTSLTVRIFEWQGRVHITVDRVWPAPHRKHPHRERVCGWTLDAGIAPDEWVAVQYAANRLQEAADRLH